MKKIIITVLLVAATVLTAFAGGDAEITFESKKFDLGNIKENGGQVTATYKFKNSGKGPLVIVHVTDGGCGCTKPSYPKEPIAVGEEGEIKIHFNPRGRKGEVNRSVRVKSNGGNAELRFSAVVIP